MRPKQGWGKAFVKRKVLLSSLSAELAFDWMKLQFNGLITGWQCIEVKHSVHCVVECAALPWKPHLYKRTLHSVHLSGQSVQTCQVVSFNEWIQVIFANIKGLLQVTLLCWLTSCRRPQSLAIPSYQAVSGHYFCNSFLNAINSTASCCLLLYFWIVIVICAHWDTNAAVLVWCLISLPVSARTAGLTVLGRGQNVLIWPPASVGASQRLMV